MLFQINICSNGICYGKFSYYLLLATETHILFQSIYFNTHTNRYI